MKHHKVANRTRSRERRTRTSDDGDRSGQRYPRRGGPGSARLRASERLQPQAILDVALSTASPTVVVATGDVADDAEGVTYARVARLLSTAGVSVRWVPGNHDDPRKMQTLEPAWSEPLETDGWVILTVDTSKEVRSPVSSARRN